MSRPEPVATTSVQSPSPARGWELAAWIAGIFSLLVGAVMLLGHLNNPTLDPLKSPQLKEDKAKLKETPADEPLKQRIRELDLQLRTRYFHQLSRTQSGVYLLLAGVALFIVAVTRFAAYHHQPPMPKPRPNAAEEAALAGNRARWSVATSGAAIAGLLFVLSVGFTSALPRGPGDLEKLLGPSPTSVAESDAATPDEMKKNWPRFRGPGGNGIAFSTNAPGSWDATNGVGIAWKTPSPAPGFNSPLIWGNRVLLSGGDAVTREVVCLALQDGQIVWRQAITDVPESPTQPPEIPESTGYAAASMATDGRRVYVIFANGDVAAVTLDGKLVWAKGFGALKNPYGHATSLATWRDRLIVQLDQGEPEDRKSRLYALDGRTGRAVWQKDRQVGGSWASPIVVEAAGKAQIVTLAVPAVISYAVPDGAELWRANMLNGEITPSPVFDGAHVIVASPSDRLVAIRPDGQGDITKSHVVWTNEDNVPDVTSPVSNGELVFAVTTGGMLTCFDAKDGKKQWEHDYEFECHASPTVAGRRVYFIGQKGVAVVVEAARQFKELFRTELPDAFHASPAFAQDRIVFRGVTNVWCIGPSVPVAKAGQP